MSKKIPAYVVTKLFLKEPLVRSILKIDYLNRKQRKSNLDAIRDRINLDSKLWVLNDFRTAIYTYLEVFKINLCDKQISTPIYHLTPEGDHFFDKNVVQQHMQIIFSNYHDLKSVDNVHLPSITASKDEVKAYIPKKVIDLLKKH